MKTGFGANKPSDYFTEENLVKSEKTDKGDGEEINGRNDDGNVSQ